MTRNSQSIFTLVRMNRATLSLLIGFFLFIFGAIALVLMFVGLQLSFLAFIDNWGRTTGLVIRIAMIFGGVIMMYLARTQFEQ